MAGESKMKLYAKRYDNFIVNFSIRGMMRGGNGSGFNSRGGGQMIMRGGFNSRGRGIL